MSKKVIIDCDPGIDDAIALIIALFDPRLDVVAVTTSAGTVPADQSAQNVQSLIEKLDPPRFPRVGFGTDPEDAPVLDEAELHGADGLGNLGLSRIDRQHLMPSEKLIIDRIKSDPGRVTILCLGPLTGISRAMQRDPSIISHIDRIVVVGGAVPGDGDITAAAEFNMYFDPASANPFAPGNRPASPLRSRSHRELAIEVHPRRRSFAHHALAHVPLLPTVARHGGDRPQRGRRGGLFARARTVPNRTALSGC